MSICKKGDALNMDNYRGINLIESLLKVLPQILAHIKLQCCGVRGKMLHFIKHLYNTSRLRARGPAGGMTYLRPSQGCASGLPYVYWCVQYLYRRHLWWWTPYVVFACLPLTRRVALRACSLPATRPCLASPSRRWKSRLRIVKPLSLGMALALVNAG